MLNSWNDTGYYVCIYYKMHVQILGMNTYIQMYGGTHSICVCVCIYVNCVYHVYALISTCMA